MSGSEASRPVEHLSVEAAGARFHVARTGTGPVLLLLHGWPEFWLSWEPVMQRLADRWTLVAPDFRGFGDSDKPTALHTAQDHANDVVAILDALGIERCGVVGHDVAGAVMQPLARTAPERLTGLFFFDFTYPGIGSRMIASDRLNHIWYQSFHQMPLAPKLVGSSREACRLYFTHIIRTWTHRQEAFDDALIERYVDNFLKPGNLEGGFNYYRAAHAGRIAMATGTAPSLPPITVPTCVRWAEHDPLFPFAWTDRLGETFADLDLAMFPGVGHFPHREDVEGTCREITGFFERIGP